MTASLQIEQFLESETYVMQIGFLRNIKSPNVEIASEKNCFLLITLQNSVLHGTYSGSYKSVNYYKVVDAPALSSSSPRSGAH